MIRRDIYILLLVTAFAAPAKAQTDSVARVSLITCSGNADKIYTLFGHSGIRVQTQSGNDYLFNYGIFNFSAPNFFWKYMLGETDYVLGVELFDDYANGYGRSWSTMQEQTLNLNAAESQQLFDALVFNAMPDNRTYRYNYFFDNCATRPRNMIERAVQGHVVFSDEITTQTFRQAIHQYTKGFEWMQLGIDLCLGVGADKQMRKLEPLFLPDNLHTAAAVAHVVSGDGEVRALVNSDSILYSGKNMPRTVSGNTLPAPTTVAITLLLLIVAVTVWGIIKGRLFWGIDVSLFIIYGIAGCILAFLALFSEHPAVSANWNLVVFHPLYLLYLPFLIYYRRKSQWEWSAVAIASLLTIFLLGYTALPQQLPDFTLLLALVMWIRSFAYLILNYGRWRKEE